MVKADSFVGLQGRYDNQGNLYFKNKNFTSTDYYSNTYMMSHFPLYWFFLTIGSRGRGKTFSGKKTAIKFILSQLVNINHTERGQLRKFMWWRLTDSAIQKIKDNNGRDFFENKLLEKYGIVCRVVNDDFFFALKSEAVEDETGQLVYDYFHVGKLASIQQYYLYKGNQLEEYDLIIMDELVRAESERRTFNIPKAFVNMIENVCRKRTGIRVLIYANAIGEMHEVKQLFGFMPLPGKFGVYKLYHKRAIIEYLDDSKEWKMEQAQTYAGILGSDLTEMTNKHIDTLEDSESFFLQRKHASGRRYMMSIKIDQGRWIDMHSLRGFYYLDTDSYTAKMLQRTNRYALDRKLVTANTIYSKEVIKSIREIWEAGKFKFSSRICYDWFSKALEKYHVI